MSEPRPPAPLLERAELAGYARRIREQGGCLVTTNGCFDVLHAGHAALLRQARAFGTHLLVLVNDDASVRRLKGAGRPVHPQAARAAVLAEMASVDAVHVFSEATPVAALSEVQPRRHVKGGDYQPADLPEAAVVAAGGGEIVIVPLVPGFSTTAALQRDAAARPVYLAVPARYGSTRFPGKPLALLGGRPVICHVLQAALRTAVPPPVWLATDDRRIARAVATHFAPEQVAIVMTGQCHTGTDRLAEAVRRQLGVSPTPDAIVINVQGDEPFVNPRHLDLLRAAMLAHPHWRMATLATPLDAAAADDPNLVKVVCAPNGQALYFSRSLIPFNRDGGPAPVAPRRHLGVYAYTVEWLLQMASLAPTALEETEKLEQLRALEHGVPLGVVEVEDVVPLAIDTPEDLAAAAAYLSRQPVPDE